MNFVDVDVRTDGVCKSARSLVHSEATTIKIVSLFFGTVIGTVINSEIKCKLSVNQSVCEILPVPLFIPTNTNAA